MLKKVLLIGLSVVALLIASGATASAQSPNNVDIQALNDLLSDVADTLERTQRVEELNACIVLARQVYDWSTANRCQRQLDQIYHDMAVEQMVNNAEAQREFWQRQQEQWQPRPIPQIPPINSIYTGPPVRIDPFPTGRWDHTPRYPYNKQRFRGPKGRW